MKNNKEARYNDRQFYTDSIDDVAEFFNSNIKDGLNQKEALQRLNQHGRNKLPSPGRKGVLVRFFSQFHNVLIYLLIVAAVVAAFFGDWVEAAVIFAVVIINVLVSFIQEGKAEKALDGIKRMLSQVTVVIREGKRMTIEAEEVIPGDLVFLKSGDRVPADTRLVSVKNLRVEESALTGESEGVEKHSETLVSKAVLGDQKNMVFAGTTVSYGEATGIVTATGEKTEIGRINKMMTDVAEKTTPLLRSMDNFGKIISFAIIIAAGGFFAFGLLVQGSSAEEMFIVSISIIVASIPEGLPAILTTTLALGVQRMAQRNAIIRKLPSVETLGSVKVICSDKTGTLTRNEMTVQSVVIASGNYSVEGTGYEPSGRILTNEGVSVDISEHPILLSLLRCARACNDSSVEKGTSGEWELQGTPTEGALTVFALKGGLKDYKPNRLDSIPFESEHKYMATLNDTESGRTVFIKGAPERIIEKCSRQLTEKGEKEIDVKFWQKAMEDIAGEGNRVIACAKLDVSADTETIEHDDISGDLVLLGLIGIIDPPRPEVMEAIQECKEAGIRVIMITGDHAATADAIAQKLGLEVINGALTGSQIEEMDEKTLGEAVKTHNVFARTNPEHKLRLVQVLQAQGMLCAMTGDGVNDAPALKTADIGIAMGIKGTEVTKEAAEMVLTDDNFATIVHAIEEGRTIYDNIKKTILFLLPANGAEASIISAAILFGITLPISPLQILWVNMVSAVTLALCLTVEPMERLVMKRKPRKQDEPIIGPSFFWRVLFVSFISGSVSFAAFLLAQRGGLGETLNLEQSRTVAVNMLVIAHTFYLFSSRKMYESSISLRIFDNKISFFLVGVLLVLQAVFTYLPIANQLFGTAPFPLRIWLLLFAAGLCVFFIVELEKFLRIKFSKKRII
ncbi:cation-transporting P-type ATPase [Pleomorphovibrio marinus]|uniref:cation-transporting P-type ATPase n=1 Tax=Pleomorphovibrio marinus TaxID=2164132 RepID=UPI000E0BAFE4|nr:cation-transporting P-type ATPase [Pleomorphovibrio marinus]